MVVSIAEFETRRRKPVLGRNILNLAGNAGNEVCTAHPSQMHSAQRPHMSSDSENVCHGDRNWGALSLHMVGKAGVQRKTSE